MKKMFPTLFILVLTLFAFNYSYATDCESEVEFCGSKFKIYCDGTVDIDLAEDVFRYKVFIFRPSGNNTFVDLYNLDTDPNNDVITTPFNSGLFGLIQPGDNAFVEIYSPCQDNTNGGHIINFSQIMAQNCPPTVDFCGSSFTINCNGTVDIDLAEDVFRYKVFIFRPNGNNTFVDLYNLDNDPNNDVVTTPFNSGIFGMIQPGDNAFVEVYSPCQDNSNGGEIINFSEILACYCSDYSSFLQDQSTNFISSEETLNSNQSYEQASTEVVKDLNINQASLEQIQDVNIYPNPASNLVNIDLPASDQLFEIQIFDLNGRLVLSDLRNSGNQGLDVNNLETGVYLIKVAGSELNVVKKIQIIR